MSDSGHVCRFRERDVWSAWERTGALRERTARRVPVCEGCGREQPARRPRPASLREVEAAVPERLSVIDDRGRTVVEAILDREGERDAPTPARGLLGSLAASGVTGSVAEPWLERLMSAGLVRLASTAAGRRELRSVMVLDRAGLAELAFPGERASRERAVASGMALLEGIDHPVAAEARRALTDEAATIAPELARALAATARHAGEGEVMAERVFSARHLGGSKALSRLRAAIEQRLGPLDALGIREGGALTLVGGQGRLELGEGASIALSSTPPFVGLSRETALLASVEPPPRGLVAVENLTVFDACCRGEVTELSGAMFVWTAGYPGRGVRAIVNAAERAGASVTAWCDLDLDGVRIARLVASWCRTCRFYRMAPEDLRGALRTLDLTDRARRAIERELAGGREDGLTATVRALQDGGVWAEQEAFLGGRPSARSGR